MKVISIDPASSKSGVVFMGEKFVIERGDKRKRGQKIGDDVWFRSIPAVGLPEYCKDKAPNNALMCWDAPLTGPPLSLFHIDENNRHRSYKSAFSQRMIEKFFPARINDEGREDDTRMETPAGISVLPYSGCSHWSVSRASLGYPLVGQYDRVDNLPFTLMSSMPARPLTGRWVVEIHPALAIWLWLSGNNADIENWRYKKSRNIVEDLWAHLKQMWDTPLNGEVTLLEFINDEIEAGDIDDINPQNDDELDAFVGWVLGKLLINRPEEVCILGCASTGSFLLPSVEGLEQRFAQFLEEENLLDHLSDDERERQALLMNP